MPEEKSPTRIRFITIFVLLAFMGIWVFTTYNGMVRRQESVQAVWAQVETQYQRRFDLVPNLESIVKGAADFEESTFTTLAEARSQWSLASNQIDRIAAINRFDSALSRLLVTVENYPELQATQAFRDFMVQLEGTENRIAVARKDYNEEVRRFNIYIKIFPRNFVANWFGFSEAAFFKASVESAEAPTVSFEE